MHAQKKDNPPTYYVAATLYRYNINSIIVYI